jgi:hypothetical protein
LKLLVGRRLAVVLGMQSMPQLSERLVRIRPNAHADIPMARQRAELVGPGDASLKGRTLQDIEEIIWTGRPRDQLRQDIFFVGVKTERNMLRSTLDEVGDGGTEKPEDEVTLRWR